MKKQNGNKWFVWGVLISITAIGLPIGVPVATLGIVKVMKANRLSVEDEIEV